MVLPIDSYRKHVEQLFDSGSPDLVMNGSAAHAQILIETLITRAKEKIVFFCECLKEEIYDKEVIIQKLLEAGKRGVEVKILAQKEPETNLLRKKVVEFFPSNSPFEFRTCLPDSVGRNAPMNFIVMDEKAFRFEQELDTHKAFASANNCELAKQMLSRFDGFWRVAVPMAMPDPTAA